MALGRGGMVLVGFRNVMWAGGGRSRFVLTRMFRVGFLQHIVVLIYGRCAPGVPLSV